MRGRAIWRRAWQGIAQVFHPGAEQTTLAAPVMLAGVGLHSGVHARVALRPAGADSGVVFRAVSGADAGREVVASPDAVIDTRLCTVVGDDAGPIAATVEHLMAALAGAGVDNVIVELDGPEVPALDGSAKPFSDLIARVGLKTLPAPRRVLSVRAPVSVDLGEGRQARFEPAPRFELDLAIDFEDRAIGRQRIAFALEIGGFARELAAARTFARARDVEAMRAAGLALGGSLDNCVVVEGDQVLNAEGLRFTDEFVRHKALDAVGDLFMLGRYVQGRYVAERAGHALNNAALAALLARPDAWVLRELAPRRREPAPKPMTGSRRAAG